MFSALGVMIIFIMVTFSLFILSLFIFFTIYINEEKNRINGGL